MRSFTAHFMLLLVLINIFNIVQASEVQICPEEDHCLTLWQRNAPNKVFEGCLHGAAAGLWWSTNDPREYLASRWHSLLRYDGLYRLLEEKRGIETVREFSSWLVYGNTDLTHVRHHYFNDTVYTTGFAVCATSANAAFLLAPKSVAHVIKELFSPRLERIHTLGHMTEALLGFQDRLKQLTSAAWTWYDIAYWGGIDILGGAMLYRLFVHPDLALAFLNPMYSSQAAMNAFFWICEVIILLDTLPELSPAAVARLQQDRSSRPPTNRNMTNFDSVMGGWMIASIPFQILESPFNLHSALDMAQCMRAQDILQGNFSAADGLKACFQ